VVISGHLWTPKRSDGGSMASKEWNAWRIVTAREYSGSHGWRPGWKGEGDCSLPTYLGPFAWWI